MKLEVTDDPTVVSLGDEDADEYHDDAYYSYWTNDPLQLTVTIYGGQPEYYTYRIYFKPVDVAGVYEKLLEDGILQDEIKDQIVFYQENANGEVTLGDYTATKEWDEDEEAWYLEFTDINPENTAGGTLHVAYPSPGTPGGDLIIYGVMYDATTKNIVSSNREAFDANWKTEPESFEVSIELDEEQAAEGLLFQPGDDGNTHVAVKGNPDQDIIWEVSMEKTVDSLADEGLGEDLIRSIEVTDVITLPAGVTWGVDMFYADPTITETVNNEGETEWHIVFSDLLGNELLTLINKSNNDADGYKLSYDAKTNQLTLTWTIQNSTTDADTGIPSSQIEAGIWEVLLNGDYVLLTDEEEFNAAESREIDNTVHYVYNYCWSETQKNEAAVSIEIAKPSSSVELTKTADRDDTVYMGEDAYYTISIYNQGVYATTDLSTLTDELDSTQYISPENIWDMFFGKDEEEEDDEYLDKNSGDYLTLTISNAMVYYSTEQELDETVAMNGSSVVYLTNANSYIDQRAEHESAVITIEKDGNLLLVKFADGSWSCERTVGSADALKELFLQMGFVVTNDVTYKLVWDLNDSQRQLNGGATRHFKVYSSMKNTFQYYENEYLQMTDGFNTADNTVVLSYVNADKSETDEDYQGDQSATAEYTSINPDFRIEKKVYQVDGDEATETDVFYRGSVITYRLRVSHFGTAVEENLPLVDVSSGSQYLLAPVNDNNKASIANGDWGNNIWNGGRYMVDSNGVSYYQLVRQGTYKNVWFDDSHCAATVYASSTNTSATPNSMTYTVTWNYETFGGTQSDDVYYSVLILSTTEVTSAENIAYLNGRYSMGIANSRVSALYDQIAATEIKSGTLQKQILTSEKGAVAEEETYAVSSVIDLNSGNSYQTKVRYKLQLETKSGNSAITFENVKDVLPYTYGIFDWDDDNVNVYSSVYASTITDDDNNELTPGLELSGKYSIYYSDEDGNQVYADGDGNYLLSDGNPAYQTIDWGTVTVPANAEGVWIYVELTFTMDAEKWAQYTDAISGNLKNTFSAVIDGNETPDTANVIHSVKKNAKAYLQKGVYWIYTPTGVKGQNTSSMESREVYYNSTSYSDGSLTEGSRIAYYIQVYNASSGYLYLQEIQDVVPDGFTFVGLCGNQTAYLEENYSSDSVNTTTSPQVSGLKGSDIDGISGVPVWVDATVYSETGEDGILRYTIELDESHEDKEVGCYYLAQGEAVSFIAEFQVGELSETDKYAVNKIAMPYLDLSGADELAIADVKGTAVNAATTSVGQNVGGCEILSDTDEREYEGFQAVTTETGEISEWLFSEVEVRRGEIIPGINKSVGNGETTGYAGSNVEWTIEVRNDGTIPMSNYTITDSMDAPYLIDGDVTYTIYDSGDKVVREMSYDSYWGLKTFPLFAIERESGSTTYNLTYYKGIVGTDLDRIGPTSYNMEDKVTIHPGMLKDGGSEAATDEEIVMDVTIKTDTDDSDLMIMNFGSSLFDIPAGGYAILKIQTSLLGTDTANGTYYNMATITPTQDFDDTLVSIGDVVTENVSMPYVKSSDQVHASGSYSTGSQKWIWNTTTEENGEQTYKIARSQMANENGKYYIELDDQTETFTYTLEVTNSLNENRSMSNLIIVDTLPQSDDYAPFTIQNQKTKRESKFQVDLLDDPNWLVVKGTKDTAADAVNTSLPWDTLLDTDDEPVEITNYTVHYSTYTDFGTGMSEKSKWSLDSLADDGSEFWTTDPTGARSIRVEINEEVENNKTVQVSFGAVISADSEDTALPGEIGWNSFAYKYTTESTETGTTGDVELWAAPSKVGVKIPNMPKLKKELLGVSSDDAENIADQTFRFLIHEGDELSTFDYSSGLDDDESTYTDDETVSKLEWDLTTALKAEDPQRAYFIIELTVSGDTSETITLDPDSVAVTDKYGDFAYVDENKYTVVELPSGSSGVAGNDQFKSAYMSVGSENKEQNYITFEYSESEENVIQVTADNQIIKWALKVVKVDQDSETPISGVVFGLYSSTKPEEGTFDALEEVYGDLLTTPSDAEKITIDGEDDDWYLIDVKTTDVNGSILFTGLTDSIYYLKELKAADGYYVPADPILVEYWNTDEEQEYEQSADGTYQIVTKTVTNKVGYLLPKTGGHGTLWIQLLGLLLMSMGVSLTYITKRKITSSRRTK